MTDLENTERPHAGSDYCHPVVNVPEKVNFCDPDDECTAPCYQDEKNCLYFQESNNRPSTGCTQHYWLGACLSSEALEDIQQKIKAGVISG